MSQFLPISHNASQGRRPSGLLSKMLSTGATSVALTHDPHLGGLQEHSVHLPPAEHTFIQAQTRSLFGRDTVRMSGSF